MSLEVKNLSVERGGTLVLETSFSANREFVLVVGPNGAGKTTLFLAILNLLPYRGEICVDGICDRGRIYKIGYVPQRIKPETYATVWEYVYLPAKFRKRPTDVAAEALRQVNIYHLRDRPLSALSGGELQRAAIARALAAGGDVLLLDEPLSNVDPQGRLELVNLLWELKRGKTILMTSHELTLPTALADKILLVNRRTFAYGPPGEVLREEVMRQIYKFVKIVNTPYGYVCVTEDFAHPH